MKEQTGYNYAESSAKPNSISERQRDDAIEAGNEILDARLSNVDYLVQKERKRIIKRWAESLPSGAGLNILDVGGRIQPYRIFFESKARNYVAIDLQFEGLIDVLANIEKLPFQSETFDVILCTQVMSYIHDPQAACDEMHRVLVPDGHLIVTAPSFFPEHHDEIWRLLPAAYVHMLKQFRELTIEPEGNSVLGLHRSLNVIFHADIENYRVRWLAERTSIPLINLMAVVLGPLGRSNTRCTANYCVLARK